MTDLNKAFEQFHQADPDEELRKAVGSLKTGLDELSARLQKDAKLLLAAYSGANCHFCIIVDQNATHRNQLNITINGMEIIDAIDAGVRFHPH